MNETQRKAFKILFKTAVSLLHACMWHSTFESAVTSQQGQDWHLMSTKGGSTVQPNTRKNRITRHLRNILGEFLELMIMIIFRYCEFPNDSVSNVVLHSLAQKSLSPCGKGIKLSLKKKKKWILSCFERKSWFTLDSSRNHRAQVIFPVIKLIHHASHGNSYGEAHIRSGV